MRNWKFKLLMFLCSLLPILLVAGFALADQLQHNYVLELQLNGPKRVALEYGETYVEEGVTAVGYGILYDKTPVKLQVTTDGVVDDESIGTYRIVYTVEYAGMSRSVSRTVCVEDNTAPVITLTEDPTSFTVPGETYVEEGFCAVDNRDGDLTAQVIRLEQDGKICYQVTDQAGNTAVAYRQVRYHDPVPPQLQLKGDATIAMMAGKDYTDPGFVATDNYEGDITERTVVTGTVDGYTPGTYQLQYSVEDNYGNVATATRTVIVSSHPVQEYVENPEKIIYLTFDDGPGPATPQLLDILKEYNVKATFFVVNTDYIDTIKRTAEEGHTVAIHTATHNFRQIYASEEAYFNDLHQMQTVIKDLTGIESKILRFPGGSSNSVSCFNKGIMTRLTALVKEEGFRYFDWNVDCKDTCGATTPEAVYDNVVAGVTGKDTAVVLLHDLKSYSVEAIPQIIEWGLANGYTFLPLNEDSPECEHNVYN